MQTSQLPSLDHVNFRKSSYSQSEAACVEIADLGTSAAIRDTQNRELGALFFGADEWRAFLTPARNSKR
ncbi:DUF397 domain-containing protein [Nocardiopsis alkaliphila]|uniref:DUF397 domain-containing protein n=1 Tax=Nocardiopsis alkaliphila TaxID=225762 RepID=UPI0009FE302D|nr:DUF397 domain-containing protein [Nocardiopsis alkaliphila]